MRLEFFPSLFASYVVVQMFLRYYLRLLWLVFYYPYFLYAAFKEWATRKQQTRRIEATLDAYIPASLPVGRPRSLTGHPLPVTSAGLDDQIFHQYASLLITKLPAELRLHIYRLVLTTPRIIHVGVWNKKYWHRICRYQPASVVLGVGYLHACWAEPRIPGDENLHRVGDPLQLHSTVKTDDQLLSLLLTCRRIYTESIGILYSNNKFNVHRAATIAHLPRSLLPQRLHSIRTIEIDIPISRFALPMMRHHMSLRPDDAGQWKDACEVLRSMRGLRSLTVSLSIQGLHNWTNSVVYYYVKPLMDISVENFDVQLPRVIGEPELARLGPLPFRVLYDEEGGEAELRLLQNQLPW